VKTLCNAFLLALTLISALHVVTVQHTSRKVFIEIQELERERDRLNEEWGKLQLEQSTWAVDDRVELFARDKLKMTRPDTGSLFYLMR